MPTGNDGHILLKMEDNILCSGAGTDEVYANVISSVSRGYKERLGCGGCSYGS